MEYHPRPAEAHHCPDPLAHIRTVAVHRTLVAFGLGISVLAAVQPCEGIIQQFPALTTQLGATVVLPAPHLNHMPDRLLLPFYASHTLEIFRYPSCKISCLPDLLCHLVGRHIVQIPGGYRNNLAKAPER